MTATTHYVVCVVDEVDERLADHRGGSYTSPPQPPRVGHPARRRADWLSRAGGRGAVQIAVTGGRRTITLSAAQADGQLLMEPG